jgi:hypothetical protein
VWKGTIALERDDRNPVCSPVTSTAEYTIVVRDGGKIEGGGTFDHGGYTCEGGFTAPPTHGTMVMYGKMGHSRLI